jgi:integrase
VLVRSLLEQNPAYRPAHSLKSVNSMFRAYLGCRALRVPHLLGPNGMPAARRRNFGSVRRLPSGRWQVRYWLEGLRYTAAQTFATKGEASAYLATVQTDSLRGTWVDPAAGKVTFAEYAEQWRASQVHRASTAAQVETYFRRHVYPRIGARQLASLRPSDIQTFVKNLSAGGSGHRPLAPATVELVYTWVSTVFGSAVRDRVIAVSPCQQVRRPAVDRQRVVPLSVKTVETLIAAMPERYRALIVLGAGTGVRISEALGLTNDRVNWLRRTLTIDRQLVDIVDGDPVFGPVKDKKNRPRTIPLPQTVVDALSSHVAEIGLGPQGLIFTGPNGGPVRRTTFSDAWRAAAGPLGIPPGDGFHQLRHFYASVLIRAGESVKTVQERLGHTSAQMTLDVYSHLWPEDEDRTRAALDAVFTATAAGATEASRPVRAT